jgi:hypothetical protein
MDFLFLVLLCENLFHLLDRRRGILYQRCC